MGNELTVQMSATGVPEVQNALKGVRRSVAARVLRSAVAYAIKPLVPGVKAAAPSKFGTLKRSITSLVKRYTRGGPDKAVVVALVGPASKFKETVIGGAPFMGPRMGATRINKPSKYAHLVEHGAKPHFVPWPGFGLQARKKARTAHGMNVVPGRQHPGAKAHPFIAPTARAKASEVIQRFRNHALKRIDAEWQRYRNGKSKRFWSTDT